MEGSWGQNPPPLPDPGDCSGWHVGPQLVWAFLLNSKRIKAQLRHCFLSLVSFLPKFYPEPCSAVLKQKVTLCCPQALISLCWGVWAGSSPKYWVCLHGTRGVQTGRDHQFAPLLVRHGGCFYGLCVCLFVPFKFIQKGYFSPFALFTDFLRNLSGTQQLKPLWHKAVEVKERRRKHRNPKGFQPLPPINLSLPAANTNTCGPRPTHSDTGGHADQANPNTPPCILWLWVL